MLVGRAIELAILDDAMARAAAGVTTLVTVGGEAGVGKTSLVDAALGAAGALGFEVLLGRCDELAIDRPFAALLDALSVTSRRATHDPARRSILDLLAATPDLASPIVMAATPDLRQRIVDALCDLVEQEALARPIALVVEDLHWADPSTVLALRSIARRVEGYRLLVVATSRPPGTVPSREREALAEAAAHRIELGPLPERDVLAVAAARLGAAPGPRLRRMIETAAGNPLVLRELLDGVADAVERDGMHVEVSDVVPVGFGAGIVRRLDSLAPRTAEVVQVASVLPSPLQVDDLAALLGMPVARLVPALRDAVRAGLFVDDGYSIGFRHDLVKAAVTETLPGAVRRMLHREAARVAIERNAPAAAVAAHLEAAASQPDDADELRTWLVRAGREAIGRAPSVAHQLLDRARATLTPDDPEAILIAVEQLEAAVNAGLLREAIELGQWLVDRDLPDGPWVGVRWWLGGALFLSHRVSEAADLFEAAAAATGDADTHALLLAYATMARLATFSPQVDELVATAVAAAEASGDAHARTLALGLASRTLGTRMRLADGLEPARRAVEVADADPLGTAHRYQPLFFLALSLFDNGRIDEARAVSRRGRHQADALGAAWADVLFHGVDALIAYMTGDVEAAEVEAYAGLAVAEETGSMVGVLWCHALLGLVAIDAGDLDRAESAVVDGEVAFASGQAQLGLELVALARGRLLAARGDEVAARDHLAGSWDVLGALVADICQERLAVDLVDVAVRTGDDDRAHQVLATVEGWSAQSPSTRAEVAHRGCAAIVARDAAALLDVAALADSFGMTADARRLRTIVDRDRPPLAGSDHPAAQTEQRSGWPLLTQAEQRVCLAIARGQSNKAIAAELTVSTRTVETHVTRVLRKLGLESRLQVGLFVRSEAGGLLAAAQASDA